MCITLKCPSSQFLIFQSYNGKTLSSQSREVRDYYNSWGSYSIRNLVTTNIVFYLWGLTRKKEPWSYISSGMKQIFAGEVQLYLVLTFFEQRFSGNNVHFSKPGRSFLTMRRFSKWLFSGNNLLLLSPPPKKKKS